MVQRRRALAATVLVVLIPLAAGCATTGGLAPSATMTTAVVGWEHWLRLDWTVQARPSGQEIDGYVYSKHGSPIINVRILAQALDASGNVVGQKVEWVPGAVPGLHRAYFRVAGLPSAPSYRVSVWAFETLESTTNFL